jgi:hypothetical protein
VNQPKTQEVESEGRTNRLTNAGSGDEVVGGPVAGADVGGLVRHQVLVVVDPGEGYERLLRGESGHGEQLHTETNNQNWKCPLHSRGGGGG